LSNATHTLNFSPSSLQNKVTGSFNELLKYCCQIASICSLSMSSYRNLDTDPLPPTHLYPMVCSAFSATSRAFAFASHAPVPNGLQRLLCHLTGLLHIPKGDQERLHSDGTQHSRHIAAARRAIDIIIIDGWMRVRTMYLIHTKLLFGDAVVRRSKSVAV